MAPTRPDGSPWPRISIVTPSYNQGRFIEETIRSILLQGYPDLEYIIIDGGSTDESVNIIQKYEPWLSYWVSEPDRGQAHAINKGFLIATGQLMNWICSDDILLSNALRNVAFVPDSNSWVIGSARTLHEDGAPNVEIRHHRYRRGDVLYNSYILNQVSVFWRSQLFHEVGGLREDLYFSMDGRLWMAFELRVAPVVIREPLGAFRIHPSQKTSDSRSFWKEFWRVRNEMLQGRLLSRIVHRISWHVRSLGFIPGISPGVGNEFMRLPG